MKHILKKITELQLAVSDDRELIMRLEEIYLLVQDEINRDEADDRNQIEKEHPQDIVEVFKSLGKHFDFNS